MTSVDRNRLKGNYAEHIVASWLSRVCLVRPVAEGTDIGVDLYCESVIQDTPFLHFWVQVKSITESNISQIDGEEVAHYQFETRHLRYWGRQPIPVYAFLVPVDSWPPKFPERLYTIKITDEIVRNGIPDDQKSIVLRTSEWADWESVDRDLTKFVSSIVPHDSSALLLQKGIVAAIPRFGDPSDRRFPVGIGARYVDEIWETVLNTSTIGLLNAMLMEEIDPRKKVIRKRFEKILLSCEENLTVLGISMLVRSAHADGEIEKAKSYVHRAFRRLEENTVLSPSEKNLKMSKLNRLLQDLEE